MLTMAACFPVYGPVAIQERGTELWEGIKTEVREPLPDFVLSAYDRQIFYSSDTTIEAAALSALESMVATLYPTDAEPPTGLAQDIIKQCLNILQEPEKQQGIAATKALAALIRASRMYIGPFGFLHA